MPTRDYFDWWQDACRACFLSHQDALDDPRPDDIPDDVPLTRHVRGGRGRGPDGEPQRPVGVMDLEEEEEYARQEDITEPSGHGGGAQGDQIHTEASLCYFLWASSIVARYKIARDAPQVQPRHPPPPCTTTDMSWIPPLTPPSEGLGVGGSAPLGHQFGTRPSWEYPHIQSGSGSSLMMPGSHHPPQPSTAPVICPVPPQPSMRHILTSSAPSTV
ncbi:hypothetical protein PIB30_074542 [Stylosanthes scabra]|uniref:Uncharacterized protein n=1 Tax=Stylosanthes scabra TaxID=79078 RepID=A0ABU6QQD2_9FABA|nr:hypothetical protein [Stylosanthes scabra]